MGNFFFFFGWGEISAHTKFHNKMLRSLVHPSNNGLTHANQGVQFAITRTMGTRYCIA